MRGMWGLYYLSLSPPLLRLLLYNKTSGPLEILYLLDQKYILIGTQGLTMTTHRSPPFRAEHLGSLLRPKEFLEKRAAFEKKELSQKEITKAEDEAITKVVTVQTEIGFRAVSDGEYR